MAVRRRTRRLRFRSSAEIRATRCHRTPPFPPRCDPSAAQGVIGLPVDAGVIEKARAAAGADMARAVRADQVGVQDFRAGRLNLYLDAQRRVARVGCG